MAKKWSDIAGSDDFTALADEDKDVVRQAYFEKVVAPEVAPDQLQATRDRFEQASGYRRRQLPEGVQPSTAEGGRSSGAGGPTAEQMTAPPAKAPQRTPNPVLADIRENTAAREARMTPPIEPGGSVLDQPYDRGPTLSDAEVVAADEMSRRPPPTQMAPSRGTIRPSDPEAVAGSAIRKATGNGPLGAVAQGVASGFAGLGKVGPGLVAGAADLVGADQVSDFALGAARRAEGFSKAVEPAGEGINKTIANIFASTVQSLPTLAFGMGGATEIVAGKAVADVAAKRAMSRAMQELFIQTAGQEYGDARNAGFAPAESAARASIFGAAEVLGERFGFHEQMAMIKAAIGKTAVPTKQLGNVLATQALKEIPGEELTTAVQFLADKYGPAAMHPKATLADYFQQAADTAVQTIGQTALMGSPGVVRSTYARADAVTAYDSATLAGFHVEPPMTTDTAKTQRAKTWAIFESVAAHSGIPDEAVKRAKEATDGMPLAKAGPFLAELAKALSENGVVSPIDDHVLGTLTAGAVDPPAEPGKTKDTKTDLADRVASKLGIDEPVQETDLTTTDGQPYGTEAGAKARATKEGAGEVVEVPGGWVVRPEAQTNTEAANEPAQPDVQPTAGKPVASVPGGSGQPAGSSGTVGRVAVDAGRRDPNLAGTPVASGKPVRLVGPPSAEGVILRAGRTPNATEDITLRDNPDGTQTPHMGRTAMLDFETGEPITVPKGATTEELKKVIRDAGAISKKMHLFPAITAEPAKTTTVQAASETKAQPDEEAFANNYAAFEGKPLRHTVRVEETGQEAVFHRDGATAMRELDERRTAVEDLMKCLKRAA